MTAKLIADTIVKQSAMEAGTRKDGGDLLDDIEMTDIPSYPSDDLPKQQDTVPHSSIDDSSYPVQPQEFGDDEVMDIDDEYSAQVTEPVVAEPETEPVVEVNIVDQSCQVVYTQVESLAPEAIDYVLKDEFGDDYEMVGYEPDKVNNLRDCCDVLRKFSFSAFGDYFPGKYDSPLTRLSDYREKNKVSQIPSSLKDLIDFKEFWAEILKSLYMNRDKNQKEAIDLITKSWDVIIRNTLQTSIPIDKTLLRLGNTPEGEVHQQRTISSKNSNTNRFILMSHSSYLPSVHSPFGFAYPSYPSSQNESPALIESKNVDLITQMVLEARRKAPLRKNNVTKEEPPVYADVPDNSKTIFLVIDTNFIISHLHLLDDLHKLSTRYKQVYQIIIPITVVSELDGLKCSTSQSLKRRAIMAIDWCYAFLHNSDPIVKGQKLTQKFDQNVNADNAILDCCLYFKKNNPGHMVVLMSNDKNLSVKALTNELLTISHRPQMTAKLICDTIVKENATNIEDRVVRENLLDDVEMAEVSSYFTHTMVSDPQAPRPPQSAGIVSNVSSSMTLEDPDGNEYIDDEFNQVDTASTPPSTTPGTINIPKEISTI
ncbi:unnamed protein product [Ambrosiozyma monospora]|uniref:Unnamed protein product n=1 Tax=Ambrosiozyma monospora TaxID=43982 RepID=A0ACB5SZ71_AMBMO|nr:unnamed protein product [Ambrosiozyma monospora]